MFLCTDEYHRADPDAVIYVHCKAGKSRSATAVMAYLIKTHHLTYEQARDKLQAVREINVYLEFIEALKAFADTNAATSAAIKTADQ
jgi:protein-tyrosine phosphatase